MLPQEFHTKIKWINRADLDLEQVQSRKSSGDLPLQSKFNIDFREIPK